MIEPTQQQSILGFVVGQLSRHGHSLFLRFTENEEQTHLVGDVIHHDDTVGTAVVAGGDGSKPLLACRVPLSKAPLKQHTSVTASTQIQRCKSLSSRMAG